MVTNRKWLAAYFGVLNIFLNRKVVLFAITYRILKCSKRIIMGLFKVIEKCTNFYFGTEKLPPKF